MSKEEHFAEQPVIKIRFKNIAISEEYLNKTNKGGKQYDAK